MQINLWQNSYSSFQGRGLAKVLTQATKDKISAKMKGRIITAEHRQKISEAMKGRSLSASHRKNLSVAMKKVREEKPEITQMHRQAQNILWASEQGEILKQSMHAQFEKQPVSVQKVAMKQIKGEKLTNKEKEVNNAFWYGFWQDNSDMQAIYEDASKKAYSKVKYKKDGK